VSYVETEAVPLRYRTEVEYRHKPLALAMGYLTSPFPGIEALAADIAVLEACSL
jgi:hypothetical protein